MPWLLTEFIHETTDGRKKCVFGCKCHRQEGRLRILVFFRGHVSLHISNTHIYSQANTHAVCHCALLLPSVGAASRQ